jgi:uncharacterized protein with NAD-binding domain and iron-sulfur cluster
VKNPCKKIVIIGGGPAGLTAGLSFLQKSNEANSDFQVIVLEAEKQLGGLSRTHNYKGNRMDIGGHRFFSKSDEVMQWWLNIMPIEPPADSNSPEEQKKLRINYQGQTREIELDQSNSKLEGNLVSLESTIGTEVVQSDSVVIVDAIQLELMEKSERIDEQSRIELQDRKEKSDRRGEQARIE